ncbi:MAG: hypothetical protein U1E67_19225 [Hyphomicrobiales bacterium]
MSLLEGPEPVGAPETAIANSIPAEACREQLARVLKNQVSTISDRGRRFLSYIVEETLAGRSDRIKAYSIATEVFGRDDSFDPQSDAIVRIEAGNLRRALERYYLTDGQSDPVVISIPKGRYVPTFTPRMPASAPRGEPGVSPEAAGPAPRMWDSGRFQAIGLVAGAIVAILALLGSHLSDNARKTEPAVPRLLVAPFEDLSAKPNSAVAAGLTQEVVNQIAKFRDIIVVEPETEGQVAANVGAGASGKHVRFALAGSIELGDEQLRLQARVVDRNDGSILWANTYEGDLKVTDLVKMEADIARQVATTIAQPYGVIFQADASRHIENPPDDWKAYSCTLAYYQYRANLDAKTHPAIRKCLEDAVARFPNYATAWALLSQTYIDEIRFRYPVEPSSSPASIERALDAARRAVELDPQNVRALQAEMFALSFSKEIEAALKVGEQALATNPNDTELMGEYGFRLAMSGNWDRGCALVSQARDRNPGPLAYYEAALALCAYFRGDYQEASMWIKKTTARSNPNYHLIAAAIYGEGGYASDAEREHEWILTNIPGLVPNLRKEAAARFARPEDVEKFVVSLRKAGLDVP